MKIQKNIILAPYTTFGIGGEADYFTIVTTVDELCESIAWAKLHAIPFFLLGKGANILIADKGYRGLVIKNQAEAISFKETTVTIESGATIEDIIYQTLDRQVSGFEHFIGIPSTLGGALWQNLHFLSPDRSKTLFLGDILLSARIYTQEETIQEVEKNYFQFGYDSSILHARLDIVLSATFQLQKSTRQAMQKVIDDNIMWRKQKHPVSSHDRSAGSIFRKIEGHGAGRLIEKVGLKGKRIGGAEISPQHANFILNVGHATAKDVRDLIALAQKKVENECGLRLETEIKFVGEF